MGRDGSDQGHKNWCPACSIHENFAAKFDEDSSMMWYGVWSFGTWNLEIIFSSV